MRNYKMSGRLLVLGLFAASAGCGRGDAQAQTAPQAQAAVRQELKGVPAVLEKSTAAHLSGAFRGAANRALPAVVYIQATVRQKQLARSQGRMFPFPSPFDGQGQ